MIDLKAKGGVARIFLDRHEKANALDTRLLKALPGALSGLGREPGLRVAVLGGHGSVFCAVERVVKALLAGEREALKMQKQLLQLWEEAPLQASIAKSIELFARAKR